VASSGIVILLSFRVVVYVLLYAWLDAQPHPAWLEISDAREAHQASEYYQTPVATAAASTLVENSF
jgi:hypothetical protein